MSTCEISYRYDWSLPWTGQQRNSLTIWKLHQHGKRTRRRAEKSHRGTILGHFPHAGWGSRGVNNTEMTHAIKKRSFNSEERTSFTAEDEHNLSQHQAYDFIWLDQQLQCIKQAFRHALCTRVPESVWRRGPGDNRGGRGLCWVHGVESLVKLERAWAHYGWCRGGNCCNSWRNIL